MEEIKDQNEISAKERNWAMIGHFGGLIPGYLLCLLIPLLVWLIKGDVSDFVYKQSREALNFQISLLIFETFAFLLVFTIVGIPITVIAFIIFWILNIFCSFRGAIRTSKGLEYRYPMNLRLIN